MELLRPATACYANLQRVGPQSLTLQNASQTIILKSRRLFYHSGLVVVVLRNMNLIRRNCLVALLLFLCSAGHAQEPKVQSVQDLIRLRAYHDETTWSKEVLAQKYESVFVSLWDNLIHNKDRFQVLREIPFEEISIGDKATDTNLEWQIKERRFAANRKLSREQALELLAKYEQDGYELLESEWHHSEFYPQTKDKPANSKVSILLHIQKKDQKRRIIVRGELGIRWATSAKKPQIAAIDASDLYMFIRDGEPAFKTAKVESLKVESGGKLGPASLHPILLHDLDLDGLPEMVVGGFNRVYWNKGEFKFEEKPLCKYPTKHVRAAVFADFDRDGIDDYLAFPVGNAPVLYLGGAGGEFANPPRNIGIKQRMTKPSSLTVGDIDGDGDLDVFMGQQKSSYSSGFIPTPYYDANDGYPFFLLLNDGRGNFRDVTNLAGLGKKRNRHVFSSTFVDLDDDNDLDLLLTNDFCGCDYFINDGEGTFTDARDTLKPTPHGFGMSHSFGDYNLDGRLDFIAIGMSSTTARRLEQMGLNREGFDDYDAKRPMMGYGNRLFLNQPNAMQQAPFNDSCARTGWSWGCTTLDFDNDGDQDLYVANGQTSGKTTKDYCTRFWCHDLYYKPGERPDAAVSQLFGKLAPLFNGEMISWNGYEHNALLMNRAGKGFVNVGFLMGCAFEFDSRAAASADFDGDGAVDLLVEHKDLRGKQRNIYLLKNQWPTVQAESGKASNWIGFHLRSNPKNSAQNAKLALRLSNGKTLIQHHATGHSVWAQHPKTIHFGIGDAKPVSLDITWSGGKRSTIRTLSAQKYHEVSLSE